MISIRKIPVPVGTMLDKYSSVAGAYTDCYVTEVSHNPSFAEFILAFYTTPLFKLERLILKLTVSRPSTDREALQLAEGVSETFAAWTVEYRSEDEILMRDFSGRTRSWLMVKRNDSQTQLFFGSAVVPKTGRRSLEFGFRVLLGFHILYSVMLLYSAASKISKRLPKAF